MTEESSAAPEGAAQETAAPAPAPDTPAAQPEAANGSPLEGVTGDWATSLDDDTRAVVERKGWKDPADAIRSYDSLERKLGERPPERPADDAPVEEWDKFYKYVGRPDAPEQYEFRLPEGVPENVPYNQDLALEYRNWAYEAGITPKQAEVIHNKMVLKAAQEQQVYQQQQAEAVEAAHKKLVSEWGDPESEQYRRHQEMARRALVQLDLKDSAAAKGFLTPRGEVTDAKFALALARAGEKMFAEDTMFSGPAAGISNPFSDGKENMTQQSLLIRSDPGRAKQLILAAGKNPGDYGV